MKQKPVDLNGQRENSVAWSKGYLGVQNYAMFEHSSST
jgi:hypothetical protein